MDDTNEHDTTRVDLNPPDFSAWQAARPSTIAPPPEHRPPLVAPTRSDRTAAEGTVSEITFATKLPPDHPGLQLERPQPRTLRRGPIVAAGAALALPFAEQSGRPTTRG
jgi:hypothetical protein